MAALAVVLGSLAGQATAAPVVFSGVDAGAGSINPHPNSDASAAAFDLAAAAIGSESLVTFENAPLGSFTNLTVAPGVTINGIDDNSAPQTIRNTPFGVPDNLFGYNTTSGGSQFVSIHGGNLTFSFASPIQFFGAYIGGVQLDGETITFSDGSSQSVPIPNPGIANGGMSFVGFTDAGKSISAVTINAEPSDGPDIISMDDVRFGTGAVVAAPEPASVTLLALGVSGLALRGLRRRAAC
jgi:hypothetical protein